MNKMFALLVVLFVFLLSNSLYGSAAAASKDEARDNATIMEEIVVTATKMPEKRKDVPNAVIIIDKKDIQDSGARTIGEILANEPGVDLQTYGDYGAASQEINIRGMRGNATQVLVNGVSVNSPSLGSADVSKIPIDNIERIEVVKGSGSLLYGSGAMGGTVNIITKDPTRDKLDFKAGVGYGTQKTYRLAAEQGMFVTKDFGYYLTAGRRETDGFRSNSFLRQNDASLKLVLDRKDTLKISLYGDFIDRTYGMPGVKPPAGTQDYYISGVKFYDGDSASLLNNSSDKDGHVVLDIKGTPLAWLGYDIKGYYTRMENYNYERYAFDGTGTENWITNQVLGTDGHLDIAPFDGAKILLGAEYKDISWKNQSHDLNATGSQSGADTTTKADLYTQGTFVQGEYRPSEYLKGLVGIRYERHSAFGSENLPLFGLVINPFETTALKINHGRHFLAPTPNDLYWPSGPYTKGNPDLQPEIGWHTDVTVEQSFLNNKLFVTASYFHWNVDNKIQWEPDSQGVWSPINLAGFNADGLEVGAKIGPYYNTTLSLSYTYTNAEEESRAYAKQDYGLPADFSYSMVKRRATMVPKNLFRGDVTYKSDLGLTVTATARYVGDRVMYNTETTTYPYTKTVTYTLGAYWTADIKIQQRLYKHWIVTVSCNNLFDKSYDTHLSSFTDQTTFKTTMSSYPGAGRAVFAGVGYEF